MKLRVTTAVLGLLAVSAAGSLAPNANAAVKTRPHVALQTLFDTYGDSGKGSTWTGGAPVTSVSLPDGRTAWSFGPTYLGTVAKNKSRAAETPWVHNSWVLQDKNNGKLSTTLLGAGNTDFYPSPTPTGPLAYEPGAAVVEGNKLYQLLWLYQDVNNPVRIDIATISLPSFKLESITASKFIGTNTVQTSTQFYPVVWGGAAASDGKYTYVYGTENTYVGFSNYAHIARIPKGQFATGSPEYWTGTKWDSTSPVTSARIFGGDNLGQIHFSASFNGGALRVIAQGFGLGTSAYDLGMFTSTQPQGPYKRTFLYTIKRQPTDNGCCAPDAYPVEVPQYEKDAKTIAVAYLRDGVSDHTSNVGLYRPQFIESTVTG